MKITAAGALSCWHANVSADLRNVAHKGRKAAKEAAFNYALQAADEKQ
jgi:hypothetical protein